MRPVHAACIACAPRHATAHALQGLAVLTWLEADGLLLDPDGWCWCACGARQIPSWLLDREAWYTDERGEVA